MGYAGAGEYAGDVGYAGGDPVGAAPPATASATFLPNRPPGKVAPGTRFRAFISPGGALMVSVAAPLGVASASGFGPALTVVGGDLRHVVPPGRVAPGTRFPRFVGGLNPSPVIRVPLGTATAVGLNIGSYQASGAWGTAPWGAASWGGQGMATGLRVLITVSAPLGTATAVGFDPTVTVAGNVTIPAPLGTASAYGFGLPPVPGQGTGIQRYRALVTDVASVYYGESIDAEIKDPTDEINGTGSCTVTVPVDDPSVSLFKPVIREVAIFRDGMAAPFWRGPIVRPSASSSPPGKVGFQCQNPLWYLSHRYFGSPMTPTNYLVNGSFEVWSGGLPVDWNPVNCTVSQINAQDNPGQVMLGKFAVELQCPNLGIDAYLEQIATDIPLNSEGIFLTLTGWFFLLNSTDGPLGGRGLYMEIHNGATLVSAATPFTIDTNTPVGLWLPATVQLEMPAAGTGGAWGVACRAYSPVGTIIWDALQLVGPESLSAAQPSGSDQSLVMANIVGYAQGGTPAGGVGFLQDHTKSDLHFGFDCPATGVMRADLVYQYADRQNIHDTINNFATYTPENDYAIVDVDPYHRNFTTFGRHVTDGVVNQGSNTFTSVAAQFGVADLYQPLWHPFIPGGAVIVAIISPSQVTFSGAPPVDSGTHLHVFIGGRRGKWRPTVPLFLDSSGANVAKVDPWDQDGDQMANSVVATGDTSGSGAYVGTALNGTKLGTLTSTLSTSTVYVALPVTAITAPVVAGDLLRVGVVQWQPGVGEEGEVVIASANVAAGATSVPIQPHQFGTAWTAGQPLTDFTPQVTMEDVLTAVAPAPIGSLSQQAQAEMIARRAAVEILTVMTRSDFIDNWCDGVPLVAGDILPVSVSWGYLSIGPATPYRIISWTLNVLTDSYTLQMNLVATT